MVEYLAHADSGGRVLFLLQLGIPDFDDSLRETLSHLRSEWKNGGGGGEWDQAREGELGW